jgi:DNA polymerase III subunit epsilon
MANGPRASARLTDDSRSLAAWLDRDLVCVDLETTGGNPAFHRIIEIGIVTLDRDGAISEWTTLVNPGTRIPPSIAGFTGIDDTMVVDAPAFADVYREVVERLEGRLFVAHNARFDYGFLKGELARLDVRWQARTLCTVKLSRRLFPEHARHNLDALIERHGLGCEARHRALGDARVLRDLLAVYAATVPAPRLLAAAEAVLNDSLVPAHLPQDLGDELPEGPGVYRFYGEAGALLYVGKSKNLRHRVLAHFGAAARDAREQKLVSLLRRVEWQETAGELGALLAEARGVKRDMPLFNRRLRGSAQLWSVRLTEGAEGAVPVIEDVSGIEVDAAAEIYGLFKKARDAKQALTEIARAQSLCLKVLGLEQSEGSCFAYQLGRCRGACVGAEVRRLHDTRLRLALSASRIKPWPFRGAVAVRERNWRGEEDLHVFQAWRYIGTVHSVDDVAELRDAGGSFDVDVYRLLVKHLAGTGGSQVLEVPSCPSA